MLFTPWRNEETDLISHYTSFQEHYLARYDEIGEQVKQYAVCNEDLDEIQQHLNDNNEDQFVLFFWLSVHYELTISEPK